MKRFTFFAVMVLAGVLYACDNSTTGGASSRLLTNGYLSYSVNGTPFLAHDSLLGGDPNSFELLGTYSDSALTIFGGGIQMGIGHCVDTGTYVLVSDTSFGSFLSNYSTDSIHTGTLRLTQFNLSQHKLSGTFTFLALKRNGNNSDTIRVINGTLYNFPVNRN